jgi:4-amino-4-deoxy-L-arabinose transferase-like glycosyltransferase
MDRRTRIIIVVIVVVAGLLRLGFSTLVVGWRSDIRGDAVDYHAIASSLAAGDGYRIDDKPTGRRPPVFPVVLSAAYKVFGTRVNVGRTLQVLLGMLVVYLVFLVTRRFFDTRTALIASGTAALNPFLIFIGGYLLTENLYMILVLTALAVFPVPARLKGPLPGMMIAVVLLAVATLTRPTGLPLAIWTLAAGLILGGGPWWSRARNGLLAVVLFALIVLPWAIRNQRMIGGWVGLTTHGGVTFYQGNNQKVIDIPHYRGGVAPLDGLPHAAEIAAMTELERERFTWEKGKEFLQQNRSAIPKIVWWKFVRFWRVKSDMGLSGVSSGWWWNKDSFLGRMAINVDVGFVYAIIVFPLFVAGIVITRKRWRELLFLYGVVVSHTAVALVFFGSIRSRIPVEPIIAIFAAITVDRLCRLRRPFLRRRARPEAARNER